MNMKQEFQRHRRIIAIQITAQVIAVFTILVFLFTLLSGCSRNEPDWCADAQQGSERAELCAQADKLWKTFEEERKDMPRDVYSDFRKAVIAINDSLAVLIQRQYRIDKHNALVESIRRKEDPMLVMDNGTYFDSSFDTMYYEKYPKGASPDMEENNE